MFIVYETVNTITNEYYRGVHKTNNLNDSYLGSGLLIKRAIKKYGASSFVREVLFTTKDKEEAFQFEKKIVVTRDEDSNSYNLNKGGYGGWYHVHSNPEYDVKRRKNTTFALKGVSKSEKHKQKMRGPRPHVNQSGSNNNNAKAITTPFGTFRSIREASYAICDLNYSDIYGRVRSDKWKDWKYLNG